MRRTVIVIFPIVLFILVVQGVPGQKSDLPDHHKKWLEEEVFYIIAPLEKEVFLKLRTDRERDLFIEAFWKQRDPTPGTPENEFKNEHFRRINYANHFYGRGTPKPGWKTDRGRMYIILGEPNDVQRFEGKSTVYATEVWFYQGKTDVGLPPGFHLVFFQQGGVGEYRLYSPVKDGPQALLTSYWGDPVDYLQAYEQLREVEPLLADVSLTLIPGDQSAVFGRPSLASDLLIQRVETVPRKQIEERYAQKFLQYKDIIEVEYTANYIDSDSIVKVIKDDSGIYFVHYAIEPARLSVNQYERKFYTTLKVTGTVTDNDGRTIFQFDRPVSIEFDESQMKSISHQPFNIHDMFPLIPGNYKFSVLIKNEVSKEFTSLERDLFIPREEAAVQMTSLILGHKVTKVGTSPKRLKPFQLGSFQVYSQPNRIFVKKETMAVAFQVHGITGERLDRAEIRYVFLRGGEEFLKFSRKLKDYTDLPIVIEEVSLADFPSAHYRIQVSLAVDGREVVADGENFDVSFVEAIPRPWIHSRIMPDGRDPMFAYLVGTQFYNSGQVREAVEHLERAHRLKPDSEDFALSLAQSYFALSEYKKTEDILLPFLDSSDHPRYDTFFLLGRAYQSLGELARAIDIFDRAVSHYGVNIHLLNVIGECHFQLGRFKEALAVWEKSLELFPDQPQIRQQVEALKEKK